MLSKTAKLCPYILRAGVNIFNDIIFILHVYMRVYIYHIVMYVCSKYTHPVCVCVLKEEHTLG